MTERIKVGISAWADKTLIASGWYPKEARDAAARLAYYATRFSLVENDAPYYAVPSIEQVTRWVDRTPPTFTMNVKAFALMTQHYTDARRLPADIRQELPGDDRDNPRLYPKDVDPFLLAEIAIRFRDSLEPLRTSGRLGLVLFQYPVWVTRSREAQNLIGSVRDLLPEDRIAIEFRNATWMNDAHRDETLAFLRDHDLIYTCVDEPQGFASSVPPVVAATSSFALFRFHGQRAARWTKGLSSARERFEYRYSVAELARWSEPVRHLAERTDGVHVIMNNCYSNYAAVNAADMVALLGGDVVRPASAA